MPDIPRPRTAGTPHLIVPWLPTVLRPRRQKGGGDPPPTRTHPDRRAHVDDLLTQFDTARRQARAARAGVPPEQRADGIAVHVEAARGYELNLKKLDKTGTIVLQARPADGRTHEADAVIWLPDRKTTSFTGRIRDFVDTTPGGNPVQNDLVANIEHLHAARLDHLWPYDTPLPRTREPVWWELWFDSGLHPDDPLTTLRALAAARGWAIAGRTISVGSRIVVSVRAATEDLASIMGTNACPTELRRPSFAEQIHNIDSAYQAAWVKDAADRIVPAPAGAPVVCVLDSGVHAEHPLLKAALDGRAWSAFDNSPADHREGGHGTAMAGLALFGNDLLPALEQGAEIRLVHHLESVKILRPRSTGTPHGPRTNAEVTVNGIAIAEALGTSPQPRSRVFSLAITEISEEIIELTDGNGVDGTATLWSAALDAVAAGTTIAVHDDRIELLEAPDPEMARLIAVSAGNVRHLNDIARRGLLRDNDYRTFCDGSRIEDPSHAWNVLCVGAYTALTETPQDPQFAGYTPLAAAGHLSPYSRTGVGLPPGSALIKPDIVLEGGNILSNEDGTIVSAHDVVQLTTTSNSPYGRHLTSVNATSAATAQAARLAALAHAAYPDLTPEAVRGLLVHEARWTPAMERDIDAVNGRIARARCVRRYGWGVPTEERVLKSNSTAVTMIGEHTITPYAFFGRGKDVRPAEANLHELPWPAEQLEELGEATVELRVTLSYFVEPNPRPRGMLGLHTYPSHRLRYALKGPRDSDLAFLSRVSAEAADPVAVGKAQPFESDKHWTLGRMARERGSLHCDIWRGHAVTLAKCNKIAVFPTTTGWWRTTRPQADRVGRPVRYALLVSLSTPEVAADLYTPIVNALDIHVPAQVQAEPQVVEVT